MSLVSQLQVETTQAGDLSTYMLKKIELYIISLWFLFLLLFVNKIRFPLCFRSDCDFIGLKPLLLLNIVPTISLLFMIMGLIFYLRFDYTIVKGAPRLPKKITKIQDLNFENLTFLITYIIPLVCFDLDFDLNRNRNLLMLFLVLTLIGAIFVKTNSFYTNPSLAVLGYRIYKIDTIETQDMIVIAKGTLKEGDSVYPRPIADNISFVTGAKDEQRPTDAAT